VVLEPTRQQSGRGADGMTDEEIDRFALVLKECERIRAMIAREDSALLDGEHEGIPMAAVPPEQGRPRSRGPPPLPEPPGTASWDCWRTRQVLTI
jgi:hypothetical protein